VTLLTSFSTNLRVVCQLLSVGTIKSRVSRDFCEKVQADANALKLVAMSAFRMTNLIRKEKFDTAEFTAKIDALTRGVARIFQRAVPQCTMATGEVMRIRMDLNVICNDLISMGSGIDAFDELASQVRSDLAKASELLDGLFDALDVPLGIRLQFDQQEDEAPIEMVPEEKTKQQTIETIDTMQGRLEQIEQLVSEAATKTAEHDSDPFQVGLF
jgi:hypothetical protein